MDAFSGKVKTVGNHIICFIVGNSVSVIVKLIYKMLLYLPIASFDDARHLYYKNILFIFNLLHIKLNLKYPF